MLKKSVGFSHLDDARPHREGDKGVLRYH